MFLLLIAYLGGVLTILSPCVLPVLPFVFARVDRPFRSHGLPMLVGIGIAFCAAASLAALGGSAIALHQAGRQVALVVMASLGLALLLPALADRLTRPLVALGHRLSRVDGASGPRGRIAAPLVLGLSAGLLWAPCAGPILGIVLTGAALNGVGLDTTLLLAAYAAGACSSLAAVLLLGGRLLPTLRRSLHAGLWARRAAGAAVLASVGALALGLDAQWLSRLPSVATTAFEQSLLEAVGAGGPPPGSDAGASTGDGDFRRLSVSAARRPAAPAPRDDGPLGALSHGVEWINSPPLAPDDLRGKVVLVNFWTYSCINCLRTLPYLKAWAVKYRDAGLVVVGVHTPEFAFEKLPANVRRAVGNLGIRHPVALDNDYTIWRAFGNRAWPAFYFVDAQGKVRHRHLGEDAYAQSERVLQGLLAEASRAPLAHDLVSPVAEGVQAAPGARPAGSRETYLGRERASGYVRDAAGTGQSGANRRVLAPGLDQWTLDGQWRSEADHVALERPHGRIAYRFHARDLHLVLGPAGDGKPIRFRVLVDGRPAAQDRGSDVDAQGHGTVDTHRLYQLVRQSAGTREALFEIEFFDPGVRAYAFTFG